MMREFFVGLGVLILFAAFSLMAVLLFPLLLLMGIFFRLILGFFLILLAVWIIGKVTLLMLDRS